MAFKTPAVSRQGRQGPWTRLKPTGAVEESLGREGLWAEAGQVGYKAVEQVGSLQGRELGRHESLLQLLMRTRLRKEILIRILADCLLIALTVGFGVGLRAINLVLRNPLWGAGELRQSMLETGEMYVTNVLLIIACCIGLFLSSGLYTYARTYTPLSKAFVIVRSVTVAYLLYGAFVFGLSAGVNIPNFVQLRWDGGFSSTLWLTCWAFTVVTINASRLWSVAWIALKQAERLLDVEPEKVVRKVLLVGGGGYIGSALIPKLVEKGFTVRVLDRMIYGMSPVEPFLASGKVELVREDFRQIDHVVRAVQGMDAVVHLGALVGDPACDLDEELTIEINLMATRMIAEVAKGCGVSRFVFASTCSVYGASDEMLDENSKLNPVSLYARTKIACETLLQRMANDTFAPVLLRFGTIYGFSGRTRFDLVINLLTAKACREKTITLFGGDQWRPFLHVEDAALGVLKALEAPLDVVRGQIFNVGSNEQNFTLEQAGRIIAERVEGAQVVEMGTSEDRRNYRVNFSKIQRTLGFEPAWTLEAGVDQVKEAVLSGRVVDYQSSEYSNVKSLIEEGLPNLKGGQADWARRAIEETAWR